MTVTLIELLRRIELEVGEAPFASGRSGTLSGDGFGQRARRLAAGLRAAGVGPGDRVAAFLEHDVEFATVPFACGCIGAVSVLVNPRLKDAQVRHVVEDAGAAVVLTSAAKGVGLEDPVATFGDRPVLVDADEIPPWATRVGGAELGCVTGTVEPDAPATILYTSGSTGLPKGIVQSHQSLCDGARIVASYLGLEPSDHLLAVLPLSFDYGLNQVLGAAWAGCRVTLLQYLFAAEVLRAIVDGRCTGLAGVPEVWTDVVAALEKRAGSLDELRSLRYVTNSGGRLPERVIRFFLDAMPWVDVFSMYGLTEAFRSSFVSPDELRAGRRGIGRAMPEVELSVVDPASGARCAAGEVGELVHRGACVADGYWQRPADSRERFRPDPGQPGRTCVYSGDLARADADGFLELVGRADAQIKVGGYRVSPDEVVEVVRRVDGVRSAAAVGVPRGADRIPALCVAVEGRTDGLADAVRVACSHDLPQWMVPAEVRVVDALPRNPNHKVDLAAVRRLFEAEGA